MKFILLFALMLSLVSCDDNNGGGAQSSTPACDNSKQLFSKWTEVSYSVTYNLTGIEFNKWYQMKDSAGNCHDGDGGFSFYITEDQRIHFRNCANTATLDLASYEIHCNELYITYDSDNATEIFF